MGGTFVAGHNGLVGSAVCRALERDGTHELLLAGRSELDLTDQAAVYGFFDRHRPKRTVIAAAVVGGIKANSTYPGRFIGENLMIQTNLLEAARRSGTERTVFLSSSCVYPREAPLPTKEESLLTGVPEQTNEWYAVAKIAGMKMAQAYSLQYGMDCTTLLPCNLYGPFDNFDLENSHVLPALLRKIHEAKESGREEVELFGTGTPTREFLHADDLAEACLLALDGKVRHDVVNVGSGVPTSIADLAGMVRSAVGYEGRIRWNGTLDGDAEKMVDSTRIHETGWKPRISLADGIASTYEWMIKNIEGLREVKHGTTLLAGGTAP